MRWRIIAVIGAGALAGCGGGQSLGRQAVDACARAVNDHVQIQDTAPTHTGRYDDGSHQATVDVSYGEQRFHATCVITGNPETSVNYDPAQLTIDGRRVTVDDIWMPPGGGAPARWMARGEAAGETTRRLAPMPGEYAQGAWTLFQGTVSRDDLGDANPPDFQCYYRDSRTQAGHRLFACASETERRQFVTGERLRLTLDVLPDDAPPPAFRPPRPGTSG